MRVNVLHNTPDNPAPENAITGYFDTYDKKKIRYAIFRADVTRAKGTVILLQGRNETIEKYYETIRDLTATGLWVATFDWRGQGGSERLQRNPLPGYVRRFTDYERDLEQFLEEIVLPDARLPFFIVAHSTGGLIALSAAPRLSNRIERIAVTSPFIGLKDDRFGQATLGFIARAACLIGLGGVAPSGSKRSNQDFSRNVLTSDPERFKRNRAIYDICPEFILGGPAFRWISESLKIIDRVHQSSHLASIRIPTLLLGAGADTIVPHHMLEDMASRFRASELVTIDYAKHELLQEADLYRDQAMAAITAFIPGES
ncbi:MAG: alpha/beta hydrolase [Alphaproteobacteria bacterium]|nr:alpha/beta hydrolase [Alphaproteobacteria bacterium]